VCAAFLVAVFISNVPGVAIAALPSGLLQSELGTPVLGVIGLSRSKWLGMVRERALPRMAGYALPGTVGIAARDRRFVLSFRLPARSCPGWPTR
jgi:hypothetical protein